MKYIKKFEEQTEYKPFSFKVGDIVKIISDDNSDSEVVNQIHKIIDIDEYSNPYIYLVLLDDYNIDGECDYFRKQDLQLATSEEIEEFQLKIDTNKYNI